MKHKNGFTQIPHLYDDVGLDAHEFRLLIHYCRRGTCYESVRETAKICKMSKTTVVSKRNSLVEKGFIVVQEQDKFQTYSVTVVDKWEENSVYVESITRKESVPELYHPEEQSVPEEGQVYQQSTASDISVPPDGHFVPELYPKDTNKNTKSTKNTNKEEMDFSEIESTADSAPASWALDIDIPEKVNTSEDNFDAKRLKRWHKKCGHGKPTYECEFCNKDIMAELGLGV